MELYVVKIMDYECSPVCLGCCGFDPVPPGYCVFLVSIGPSSYNILSPLRLTTSVVTLFLELSFWPGSQPPSLHPLRPAFMCILWNINVFLGLPSFLVSFWVMGGFSCGNKSACVWQSTTALSVYVRCVLLSQYVRGRRKANWPTTNNNICSHKT